MSSNPRIYGFDFSVGSGVEVTARRIYDIILKDYDGELLLRKHHAPLNSIIREMKEFEPEVIIINELHQRAMLTSQAYKIFNPDVKVILLNHCHPYITEYPIPPDSPLFENTDSFGVKSINEFLLNGIDHIINLNHIPEGVKIKPQFKDRAVKHYFPIPDSFKLNIEWRHREKDFMYFGALNSLKFHPSFCNVIEKTDIKIDVFSEFTKMRKLKTDGEYKERLESCKNLNFMGRIPEGEVEDVLNQYRFMVIPHMGPEPFMIAMAEAVRCGCIPLIHSPSNWGYQPWLNWARPHIVIYNSFEKMVERMSIYKNNRDDPHIVNSINETVKSESQKMTEKTNIHTFSKVIMDMIKN